MTLRTLLATALLCVATIIKADNISLNGAWRFLADSVASYAHGLPADRARPVSVPHTWNVDDGLYDYMGAAWYERQLDIPATMKGQQLRLHFAAVYHSAVIYVNGHQVGDHRNAGYTPFSVDITKAVSYGGDNKLVVRVDNRFSDNNLPFRRHFDWTADGGIYRDVWLHVGGRQTIRYVHVTPAYDPTTQQGSGDIAIRLYEAKVSQTTAKVVCRDKATGDVIFSYDGKLKRQQDGEFHLPLTPKGQVKAWHFDHPNLYTFEVSVGDGKQVSDVNNGQFGFRKWEIVGSQLKLNGEAVRLPGLEYMAGCHPDYGSAEPREHLQRVVSMMKNANITLTRFHWAQDDALLTMMDEQGILVQEELPWWQQPDTATPELIETAKRQLQEMIEAHYNHPSIVMWGLSNEVYANAESLKPVRQLAERLDATRPLNVVCNHTDTQLAETVTMQYALPTWNEYVGTWNGSDRTALPGKLSDINKVLQGRPLLIAEVGRCEPAHTGGDARRIDDMIYHLDEYNRHDEICAYIYFCLNDYRTQMGEEGYGKYRIRRHGVADVRLEPKPSYQQLSYMASPIEIESIKSVGNDDHDVRVVLRVKNQIPSYTLKGYKVVYTTDRDTQQSLDLPTLSPGERYETTLRGIGRHYQFEVQRPGGYRVAAY